MSSRKLSRELSKEEEQEYQSLPLLDGFLGCWRTYRQIREHRPKMYRELEKAGLLERSSRRAEFMAGGVLAGWPIACGSRSDRAAQDPASRVIYLEPENPSPEAELEE